MSVREIAEQHDRQGRRLAISVAAEGRRLWSQVDPANLGRSWASLALRLSGVLAAAQNVAAGRADDYVDAVLAEEGIEADPAGSVRSAALSGVASDGRPLQSLLMSPVVHTKMLIGRGHPLGRSLTGGAAELEMILRTQVADAGRVAEGIAVTSRPQVGGYVRMTVGKTCPRCAVLAGKFFRWNQGFQRHPACDCRHVPASESIAGDLRTDPRRLFDEGQIRGLTRRERQAIEDGADVGQVVNARRGMYTAGGRRLTREGATRRGRASRRMRELDPNAPEVRTSVGRRGFVEDASDRRVTRLMPEQIYREATSRAEAVRLLRLHGYLI